MKDAIDAQGEPDLLITHGGRFRYVRNTYEPEPAYFVMDDYMVDENGLPPCIGDGTMQECTAAVAQRLLDYPDDPKRTAASTSVAGEREMCARLAESYKGGRWSLQPSAKELAVAEQIARLIRERGNSE